MISKKTPNAKLTELVNGIDEANEAYLDNNKAPGRKVNQPDNKASHYYFAMYWADALASSKDKELSDKFTPIAKSLKDNEEKIMGELMAVEGSPKDINGYYLPSDDKAFKGMRASVTLNNIIDNI